jgi:hypothetical protein
MYHYYKKPTLSYSYIPHSRFYSFKLEFAWRKYCKTRHFIKHIVHTINWKSLADNQSILWQLSKELQRATARNALTHISFLFTARRSWSRKKHARLTFSNTRRYKLYVEEVPFILKWVTWMTCRYMFMYMQDILCRRG